MHALKTMQLHHGRGLGAAVVGTASGFAGSVALGALYGKYRDKWWGKWMPAFFAAGGKLSALALFVGSKGHLHMPAVILNDLGQAGVNALGLDLGIKAGLKWADKQLVVMDAKGALPSGGVRIAGELPPADPGRGLENISVEELANLR
jgi:hypothetical protein